MLYFQSCLQGSNLLNLSLKNEASLVAQMVTNLPAKQEILGRDDPLEKGMTTYSSILAWKNPWTEEPGGATVHGVAKSRTWQSGQHFHFQPLNAIIQQGDEQWVFSALLDKGKYLTQYGKRRYQARISRLHKPIYNSCSTPPHSSFPATKCHGDISLFVIICNLQTVTGSFCLFHQSFSWLSSTYGSTAQESLRRDSSELHEALCKLSSGFWCG